MNTLRDYVNFKLTHADKTAEAEGYPLTMENCKKYKKMKQLELYGNSFQDGTPTPDNPIEVQSVGEKSVNLFDKDNTVSLYASTTAIYNVTETGISCYCTTNQKNIFFVMDLGLASDFEGKNMRATMNCPVINNEKYLNTMFITCEADGSNRKEIGSRTVTNDEVYAAATIGTGYTTQRLCLRLYVQSDDYLKDTYHFNNIMVYEGTDKRAYEPFGKYKIPVVQRGINYFSMAKAGLKQKTINGITFTPLEDERIHIKGTLEDTTKGAVYNYTIGGQPVFEPGIYNAKNTPFVYSGTDLLFNTAKASGGNLVNINSSVNNINITERAYISGIYISIRAGNTREWDDIWELQVTQGANTRNLPYEPYIEPVTTNIFLDEPLRKIGNYADYIDFKGNKVVRKCCKRYLADYGLSATNTKYDNSYHFYSVDNTIIPSYINQAEKWTQGMGKSNIFPVYGTSNQGEYDCGILTHTWAQNIHIIIPKEYLSEESVAVAKAWLTENNAYMIRVLAEPTEEPLNIELPKLKAKTTIVEIDTSLAPSDAYGKYIKK